MGLVIVRIVYVKVWVFFVNARLFGYFWKWLSWYGQGIVVFEIMAWLFLLCNCSVYCSLCIIIKCQLISVRVKVGVTVRLEISVSLKNISTFLRIDHYRPSCITHNASSWSCSKLSRWRLLGRFTDIGTTCSSSWNFFGLIRLRFL